MTEQIGWGILGTGNIAHTFATGLSFLPDARLVAVGSRSPESAEAFAREFDLPRHYGSYQELAGDPEIQVVYVATPHSLHYENSLACLEAGKAVLCEKPFTINAREAERLIAMARERNLFLMEAMWTRFLPVVQATRELLNDGAIGEPRMLAADFGFRTRFNPAGRLFDPSLGGGALMDVGVYPVSLASMIFGAPDRLSSLAELGETGVDEQSAFILGYPSGQLAVLYTAIRTTTPQEATIMGTEGLLRIEAPWWRGTQLMLRRSGEPARIIDKPFTGNGYNYEAAEVMSRLRSGAIESELLPLSETLAVMQTMDQIRAQWDLVYPVE